MRQALKAKATSRQQIAEAKSTVSPVGGWNARDALAAMKPTDAVILDNWFPSTTGCDLRGGYADSVTGMDSAGKTLAVYNKMTGVSKMYCSTNYAVWDVSSPGALVANYLNLTGAAGAYASSPDSATASIVGDIDIRVYASLTDWTPAAISTLVAKSLTTGNQRSYFFGVKTDGTLQFQNSPDGTAAALVTSASSVAPTVANGDALWVRVTVDVNDGAGGNVVKFYTSADYNVSTSTGTWTQLGTTVTNVGTTSIFDSTALVEIGSRDTGTTQITTGKVYAAQIYSGIAGTLAVQFNARDTYAGDTSFASFATTEVWTVNGAASIIGSAVASCTNGKWQWINYGDGTNNYLIMVNGTNKPIYFDGTTWVPVDASSSPALTGLTTTKIIHVFMSKGRLYFIEKDSLSFWYLAAGAAGGALTEFDLSGVAQEGGYLVAGATWTVDGGDGPDDRIVFITSKGEVLVYVGTNPSSATTFSLVGVYKIGNPIGRKCMKKIGGDLVILTQNGAFPLSAALQSATIDYKMALSFKIEKAFNDSTRVYGATYGWTVELFPKRSALIVNVPLAEDGTHYQYVMNTITKSWCRFKGWNAEDLAIFNDDLFFCVGTKVMKAWDGAIDGTDNIVAYGKQAYNYFGGASQQKRFHLYRPMMVVNGPLDFNVGFDVDFADAAVIGSATYNVGSTSLWDTGLWDSAIWGAGPEVARRWTSPASGAGYCVSGKVMVSTNSLSVSWVASDYVFERGGIL